MMCGRDDCLDEEQTMPKKKARKAAKKATAPLPPSSRVEEDDAPPAAPVSQSIESDVPAIARHSIEADDASQSGDVERLDE
jgi:hypothetical protein